MKKKKKKIPENKRSGNKSGFEIQATAAMLCIFIIDV